jgi:hypothetical protein
MDLSSLTMKQRAILSRIVASYGHVTNPLIANVARHQNRILSGLPMPILACTTILEKTPLNDPPPTLDFFLLVSCLMPASPK